MHELALAHDLVQILCEEARRHGLERIQRIKLRVGALRAVVPELLSTSMEFASKGTVAEGTAVDLEVVQAQVRCPDCRHEYEVTQILFVCPQCERLGGELLSGQELTLVELEGE